MSPGDAALAVSRIRANAQKDLDLLLASIRTQEVMPYCDRHTLRFVSGLHTGWRFFKGERLLLRDQVPSRLAQLLDTPHPFREGEVLGIWVHDYTARLYRPSSVWITPWQRS